MSQSREGLLNNPMDQSPVSANSDNSPPPPRKNNLLPEHFFSSQPQEISIRDSEVEKLMVGIVLDINSIKKLVIKYQNRDKGFYCFEDWLTLHNVIFEQRSDTSVQMWRILKLVNFGDDYIPTGLIFDTLVTLLNIEKKAEENELTLQRLFLRFIQVNGKSLTQAELDEISYLKILRRLVVGYKDLVTNKLRENYLEDPPTKQRYEKLYELHNLYTYKKNLGKLKKIEDEMKECSFEPELRESRHNVESRYMTSPRLKEEPVTQEEQLFEYKIFRANPVPEYPEYYPLGYVTHVSRMKETFEYKYYKQHLKPKIVKNKNLEEFTINERDRQRKQQSIVNKKVLFLIDVEVGKRKYVLKVRQGMTEEDVVKQIETMVGFSDKEISLIVEQYFINYFKKINNMEI